MGGASVMQVAAERPDLVAGVVLVEPVLISKMNLNILKIANKFPITKSIPVIKEMTSRSDSTLKRRVEFPNKEMIIKSYTGRGAFATWGEGFLEDYIDGGTETINDKIRLTCDPKWEAATFASWKHNAMDSIKKISCPITLLQGEVGSTTRNMGVRLLKKQDPKGEFQIIKSSSHFLPMEFPKIVQQSIIKINSRLKTQDSRLNFKIIKQIKKKIFNFGFLSSGNSRGISMDVKKSTLQLKVEVLSQWSLSPVKLEIKKNGGNLALLGR